MKVKTIKTLALLLALSLIGTIASCGKNEPTSTDVQETKDPVVIEKNENNEEKNDVKEPEKKEESPKDSAKEDKKEETPSVQTPDTSSQTIVSQQPEVSGTPDEETSSQATAPSVQAASAYIGKSASSLANAIGQPSGGKTYVTSCMGEGDDGEWYYPGFTVYTYRAPNGSEKVIDVLGN